MSKSFKYSYTIFRVALKLPICSDIKFSFLDKWTKFLFRAMVLVTFISNLSAILQFTVAMCNKNNILRFYIDRNRNETDTG